MTLAELLKDSAYKPSQFKPEHIASLGAAKRAVEIAIESSEDAALAYLAQHNSH